MSGWWWWPPPGATADGTEAIAMPTTSPEPTHPYHPLGVNIPAYEANEASVPVLLAALGGTLGFAMLSAALVARKFNPGLGTSGLAIFCWFIMSKSSYFFLKSYGPRLVFY